MFPMPALRAGRLVGHPEPRRTDEWSEVGHIELSDLDLRGRIPEHDVVAYSPPFLRAADAMIARHPRTPGLGEQLSQATGGTGDDRGSPGLVGQVGGSETDGSEHKDSDINGICSSKAQVECVP